MNSYGLVSVVIPVFNVEQYLSECVESVINQSYKNLDIILVNDGSTDKSGELCDQYATADKRIRVIHKANGGLSDARNEGVKKAKGEVVSFIDSDDYVSPYFIEIMVNVMLNGNCDFVVLSDGPSFWDGEEEKVFLAKNALDYSAEYVSSKEALERMLLQNIATGAPFKLYKKKMFEAIQFPIGYLYEDVATTYKFFFQVDQVGIVKGNLYAYRMRKNSIIRQKFNENKLIALKIFSQLVEDNNIKSWGMEKAAISRGYAMLFSVFLQVPENDFTNKKLLWEKLKVYRMAVLFNSNFNMRMKNRLAAVISFLGMNITYKIGRKFGQRGSMN